MPVRAQPALEHDQRGQVDQLRACRRSPSGTGIEPSAPALPVRPAIEPAVEHDAAARECADVEIDEVAQPAVLRRRRARRRRPTSRRSADRPESGELAAISARMSRSRQAVHLVARRADLLGPVPELERHGHAEAGDARGAAAEAEA